MATAMPDFTAEAHKCIGIRTIETDQIVRKDALSFDQFYNLYHFARLHPETHERIFPKKVEKEGRGSTNFYSESELKALSLARLQHIAESFTLSTEGRKIDLIQNILRAQVTDEPDIASEAPMYQEEE